MKLVGENLFYCFNNKAWQDASIFDMRSLAKFFTNSALDSFI